MAAGAVVALAGAPVAMGAGQQANHFRDTNPLTGDTVLSRFAGPTWVRTVSGDPAGLHVEEVTVKGLPELFKFPHGGVITRDAGYIVLRNTFNGDTFISGEIVVNKGPHPEAESDFELFCQFMPEALGL